MENNLSVLVERAYKHTFAHYREVQNSTKCGCGYCCRILDPKEVNHLPENGYDDETAWCPYCGVDIVFGDASGIEPTPELLKAMRKRYF